MTVEFIGDDKETKIRETFDSEPMHSEEQRSGWQPILDRFAKYVENK